MGLDNLLPQFFFTTALKRFRQVASEFFKNYSTGFLLTA